MHGWRKFFAFFILLFLAAGRVAAQSPSSASPPPVVGIAAVKLAPVTQQGEFVGTVVAIQQVNLQSRVEGFLDAVKFTEGGFIKAGDVAYVIQKNTYQAALDSARASLQSAEAGKAGADANLKQAELTLARQKDLLRTKAVSQAAVDQATAARDTAEAQVRQSEAQIAQAQAQVETAKLNLSYTEIRTPISGRIGKTAVTVGNLVSPSTGTLATVVQTDPIRVAFSISDRDYLQAVRVLKPTNNGIAADAARYQPRLTLPDGTEYKYPGKISFLDNVVNPSTGTIAVYADFPNPDLQLVPGQYVSVAVQAGEAQRLPVVPAEAVQQDREGPYVFVLGAGNRATIQRIKLGQRIGTDWAVPSGLADGATIIVSGIQKIRPGIVVSPTPAGN